MFFNLRLTRMNLFLKNFFILILIVVTLGCSREPLEGTIYVIKGNGNINRAAAVDIHILDFENIQEFDNFIAKKELQTEDANLSRYLSDECPTFVSSKKETLRKQRNMLEQYSNECDEAKKIISELPFSEEIKKKILQEEKNLVSAAKKEFKKQRKELQSKAQSKIKVSFDFSRNSLLSKGRYTVVSITNENPFSVSSGGGLGFFVEGKLVAHYKPSVLLDPGETKTISLGETYLGYFISDNIQELIKEGAEKCVDKKTRKQHPYVDFDNAFCFDDFAPIVSDSSNEKKDWLLFDTSLSAHMEKFRSSQNKSSLVKLESELKVSNNANSRLQECTLQTPQIVRNISALEKLSCPAIESDRKKIQLFYQNAENLGINLSYPPIQRRFEYSDFIATHTITSDTSDVNGKFSFQAPPNKNFILYARYEDNFSSMEWVLPITSEVKTIELNNSNAFK